MINSVVALNGHRGSNHKINVSLESELSSFVFYYSKKTDLSTLV